MRSKGFDSRNCCLHNFNLPKISGPSHSQPYQVRGVVSQEQAVLFQHLLVEQFLKQALLDGFWRCKEYPWGGGGCRRRLGFAR